MLPSVARNDQKGDYDTVLLIDRHSLFPYTPYAEDFVFHSLFMFATNKKPLSAV